jgi:hypothetical protein
MKDKIWVGWGFQKGSSQGMLMGVIFKEEIFSEM